MGYTYPDDYYITWWGFLNGSFAGDGSVIPQDNDGYSMGFIGGRTNSQEGMFDEGMIEGMIVSLYF